MLLHIRLLQVFNHYMKENYFTSRGIDNSSFNLNVAACRLLLDILPGLEITVLQVLISSANLLRLLLFLPLATHSSLCRTRTD